MYKKTWMLFVGIVGALALAGGALAAVTFDSSTGTGFVSKGDVQTALGYNNAQLQANANSLTFTYSQEATQALSQEGTQAGSQEGTETLTCVDVAGIHIFTRAGTREGSRDVSRDGTREGTQSGAISSAVSYDARKHNQVDGFYLTGFNGDPTFVASGDPTWGDWSFGDWSFGDWSWGDWTIDPNSSPGTNDATLDACLNNGSNYDSITDDVTPGDITEGDIAEGDITYGDITPTGSATLYVNGVALT